MPSVIFYAIISTLIISLISFVGIITLSIKTNLLKKILIYLISFSAGALFGDAFIHLLPEVVNQHGFGLNISLYLLSGIVIFFFLEKVIHWQHCHSHMIEETHIHPFAYTNLIGDGLHNLLDGIIIGASYLVSIPAGIATTIAVGLHEIPQEIGDFGVLIHGGFSKTKAILLNSSSSLLAFVGLALVFLLKNSIEKIEIFLIPIAAGGFIYIAGSDLIPELQKHSDNGYKSLLQLISFIVGILIMVALLWLE